MNLNIMKILDIRLIYRNIFNILIVVIALLIARNIYNNQDKNIRALRDEVDIEAKKNVILADIGQMGSAVGPYKQLFNNKDASFIVNAVSGIADEQKIKVVSFSPGQAKDAPPFTRSPFILTISADNYHSIGKFINQLESYDAVYLTIDNMDIRQEAIQGEEAARKITADLQLSSIALEK